MTAPGYSLATLGGSPVSQLRLVCLPYGPTVAASNVAIARDPELAALLRDGWRVSAVWTEAPAQAGLPPNVVVALAREGREALAPAASDARSTAILAGFAAIVAVFTTLLTLVAFL